MAIPALPFLSGREKQIYCFDDARRSAMRRLPRMVFDYIDGAAGSEQAMARNRAALDAVLLSPKALVNVDKRSLETRLFDSNWNMPFGVSPMGMCNLSWPGGDQMLAEAAVDNGMPIGLSTAASSSIEQMAERAGENLWFQLYVGQSIDLGLELVERASVAGCQALILTVDVPVVAARTRDQRNGFKAPLQIGPRQFLDFALHPEWSLKTLKQGVPQLANFSTGDDSNQQFNREEGRGKLTWEFVRTLRDNWKGKLVIKGVLHPDDARRALDHGVEAVYVSNHGGRQLDSAPAAITQLKKIRQALGPDATLLFDSGVRSGDDIVRALCCGADFVFVGRPFLFAMGAAGAPGLQRMIDILSLQTSTVMAQIGATSIDEIDQSALVASTERGASGNV